MKSIRLARNESSFRILDDWHEKFESQLRFESDTRRVETSFGFTNVIVTGGHSDSKMEQPPVLVLHGAMSGAPFALGELCDLPSRRRIYAVNIPGQSTRASQTRLDFRTDEYGRWLSEVMDGLGLDRTILSGVSWGGSVALQMAKTFPDRVSGMVLVVPGSIVRRPIFQNLWHVGLPMMRFKMRPTPQNRDRALRSLLTTTDRLWSPYLGDAIRHWNVDFAEPPLIKKRDLASFSAPVFVIAADRDIAFPGPALIERSRSLFTNLVGTHLLENSCHSPSFLEEDRRQFTSLFEQATRQVATAAQESDSRL